MLVTALVTLVTLTTLAIWNMLVTLIAVMILVFMFQERSVQVGVNAITCFLHACRHQNESKSRKYLAKVIWLLTFDEEKMSLAEAVDKYCVGVPPIQWLPWFVALLLILYHLYHIDLHAYALL